jgi:hypothetical protein
VEPVPSGAEREAPMVWSVAGAVGRFSRVSFAYAISAAFASLSALAMGLVGEDIGVLVIAVAAFLVSGAISAYVLTDLLEFLWDGMAGHGPSAGGLWNTTLALLLAGMLSFAVGIVVFVAAISLPSEWWGLMSWGIALFAACALLILLAIVLPSFYLGRAQARWAAALAAAIGGPAVVAEAVLAILAPSGSSPWLGWMEGAFPLLNWNVVLGVLVAASALLVWRSYKFVPTIVEETLTSA